MSNRACYINKIVDEIKSDVIKVGETSAIELKPLKILLPIGGKDGANAKLETKEQTKGWARRIQKIVNDMFNSKAYGNMIAIDDQSNPRGTVIDILIPKRLIDAIETKNGDNVMFQESSDPVSKKNELYDKVYTSLDNYIKVNNISVEFYESLKNEYPSDPVAVFKVIDNAIKINQGRADYTTLPEEISHHLVEALGEDNILIQRAMNLIGRVGVEEILGTEYESYNNTYKGDKTKLRKEALGKLISKAITGKAEKHDSKSDNGKLWDTIMRIIDRFVSMFRPNDNIMKQLEKDVEELSSMILSGKKTVDASTFTRNKPTDEYYQLSANESSRGVQNIVIPNGYEVSAEYYRRKIKALENEVSVLRDSIDPKKSFNEQKPIREQINAKNDQKRDIENALYELKFNSNKQPLMQIVSEELNRLETYIGNLGDVEDTNIDDIEHVRSTLHVLMTFPPTKQRASDLLERFRPYIKEHAYKMINQFSSRTITREEIELNNKDIFVGTKNFGTLSDVTNHIARTIGELIKNAQDNISKKNKESYHELEKELDDLRKYTKSKGIADKDMFNVFIQEIQLKNGNTTTSLTKKYSPEFYKRLNDTFQMDSAEEGKAARKQFAQYNSSTNEWESLDPDDINENYKKILASPELSKFYNYFKRKTAQISNKLPVNLHRDFIPNVVEESLMDILKSDKDWMAKLKEGVQNITEMYGEYENESGFLTDKSINKDELDINYYRPVSADRKTKDLGRALLKFMYFANSYEEMSEILPKTRLLQEEIERTKFRVNTNEFESIKGSESNVFKMADKFIEMQVLGKMKNEEVYGKVNYGKLIDFFIKYTSLLRIGFNPFNAFTNVVIGNIGNVVEAVGGRFFNMRDYVKANAIYGKQIFDPNSKVRKIMEKLNPLMELEDYQNLEKIGIGYLSSKKYQDRVKSMMYSFQRRGENQLQVSVMIANLLHDKATDKDGNKVSLWEAFNEDGTWNTEKFGELSEQESYRMSNKIQRINQMIHGRYSSKDAAILNQHATFRAAFQFKKWIPAALEARFGDKKFDERLGAEIEGRYNTYLKAIKLMMAKLKGDVKKIEELKFTESDWYNTRKNMTELVIVLACMIGYYGLKADDDDKDLKNEGWYKFSMMQLDRVSSDLLWFMNPLEMNRTFATGFVPIAKTIRDLGNVVTTIPYVFGYDEEHEEFSKGPRKGEHRTAAAIRDVIPFEKPIVDVYRLFKDTPYTQPRK